MKYIILERQRPGHNPEFCLAKRSWWPWCDPEPLTHWCHTRSVHENIYRNLYAPKTKPLFIEHEIGVNHED